MELKIISFNIRNRDDPDGHSVAERAPRLAEAVKPYDADIIGFQEHKPMWEPYLDRYFSAEYGMFNKYRDTVEKPEAAPIFWKKDKFELLRTGYFWLSDTPEEESRGWDIKPYKRMCEYVILRHRESGKEFTYMNTHFGFGDDCQIKSARLITEYAKRISDLPTFVTGDFNMYTSSLGYAEMTKYFTDVNAVTSKDMRATFHGYAPEKYPNSHIDYCFTDAKVKPLCRELIDKTFEGKYPSDHYGLFIKLEI